MAFIVNSFCTKPPPSPPFVSPKVVMRVRKIAFLVCVEDLKTPIYVRKSSMTNVALI